MNYKIIEPEARDMPCINRILITCCACIALIFGCEAPREASAPEPPRYGSAFKIGIIPELDIFNQLDRYELLSNYLSRKIQADVELVVLTRYGNIVENFVSGNLDAAFFGSFTYCLANHQIGVEVIARPEYENGVSEYYGMIFTRVDSRIKSVKDMKGKTIVFVDKATTAGYLFPMAYLKENGVDDTNTFFKEIYFAGSHEDAIRDVVEGRADIGACKNTVYSRIADENPRIDKVLYIIAESQKTPENGFAVKKDMDERLKKKLKDLLLNMHEERDNVQILTALGVRKFVGTEGNDYSCVFNMLNQLGWNLSDYEYVNE